MRAKRKNYLPTLLLVLLLWGLLVAMIIWVEPNLVKDVFLPGWYLPFWLLFFPACFLSLAMILGHTRRGFLTTLGLTSYLILRMLDLGNWLNFVLIIGLIVALDKYFQR